MQLKHLELYVDVVETYELMSEDYILDQKIMMWAVKEIYLSPYKVYLNNLDRKKFVLKYLKTKKYIVEKKWNYRLEEIINYFIACLHEEFENGRGFK